MTTQVLACIDCSRYQSSVCQHAAWAAARLMAPLHLLHVLDQRTEVSGVKDYSGSIGQERRMRSWRNWPALTNRGAS